MTGFMLMLTLVFSFTPVQAQQYLIHGVPFEVAALLQKQNNEYITTLALFKILDQQLEEVERRTLQFIETGHSLDQVGLTSAIASTSIAVIVASMTKGAITPSTSRLLAAYAAGGLSLLSSVTSISTEVKKNEVDLFNNLQFAIDYTKSVQAAAEEEAKFSASDLETIARLETLKSHLLDFQKDQLGAKSEVLIAAVGQFFGSLATIRGMQKSNTLVVGAPVLIHIGNLLQVSTRLSRDRGNHFLSIVRNTRQAIATILR